MGPPEDDAIGLVVGGAVGPENWARTRPAIVPSRLLFSLAAGLAIVAASDAWALFGVGATRE